MNHFPSNKTLVNIARNVIILIIVQQPLAVLFAQVLEINASVEVHDAGHLLDAVWQTVAVSDSPHTHCGEESQAAVLTHWLSATRATTRPFELKIAKANGLTSALLQTGIFEKQLSFHRRQRSSREQNQPV